MTNTDEAAQEILASGTFGSEDYQSSVDALKVLYV